MVRSQTFDRALENVLAGSTDAADIVALLAADGTDEGARLFAAADAVRRANVGDEIFLRGIVEISNVCRRNCCYCGLRRDNRSVRRYRMPPEQIMDCVHQIKSSGCTTVVLQSGESCGVAIGELCEVVGRIKAETGLAVTLSLGEMGHDTYSRLKAAGADRYLLRHETADHELYRRHHPDGTLDQRLSCLSELKALGYEVGAGCLVGLPGQTLEHLAQDVRLMRELDVDMIGLGPFIPHAGTPLAAEKHGSVELALKVLAVMRLVTKDTNIPATTALGVLDKAARCRALTAGANVLMPVFTPEGCARDYNIYPGKEQRRGQLEEELAAYDELFGGMGRRRGCGPGDRGRKQGGRFAREEQK